MKKLTHKQSIAYLERYRVPAKLQSFPRFVDFLDALDVALAIESCAPPQPRPPQPPLK